MDHGPIGDDDDEMKIPVLAFKLTQKPRSVRNNGARKLTWGWIDVPKSITLKAEKKPCRRQSKKRRRREMASDGDMEWEALTGETSAAPRKSMRAKTQGGLSLTAEDLNGETAAVAVGLRADMPGPAERIRFKDLLKRRGGLQEYLECRNLILGLWERDVRHSLCITDCGISSAASFDDTPRESLLRDIYDFLNYHGYINLGITSKKLKVKPETQTAGSSLSLGTAGIYDNHQTCESNQELQAAHLGSTLLEKQNVMALDPEPMDIDEKPLLQESQNLLMDSRILKQFDQNRDEKKISSPALCGDDESLLDIVNRLKARSRKKRAPSQKLEKFDARLEKAESSEEHLNGQMTKMDGPSSSKLSLDGQINEVEAVSTNKPARAYTVSKIVLEGEAQAEAVSIWKAQIPRVEMEQTKASDFIEKVNHMDLSVKEEAPSNVKVHVLENHCKQQNPESKDGYAEVGKLNTPDNFTLTVDELLPPPAGDKTACQRVIIVGAGPAGLAAGRHLQNLDIPVIILEARERVGGRVLTDRTMFSGPVDLGASIITGVEADVSSERRPDPTALLCKQLDLDLTTLGGDCPLFDSVAGTKVPAEIDEALEAEYNSLLDDTIMLVAQSGDVAMQMSLEEGLELVLRKRREQGKKAPKGTDGLLGRTLENDQGGQSEHIACATSVSESDVLLKKTFDTVSLERRVMDWHFANLEYGCAAELNRVSLPYWNQDDVYGGFAGPHCMIKGGYGTVMEALGDGLPIHFKQIVTRIEYFSKDEQIKNGGRVKVHTKNGDVFMGDAVLVTVPLGCLKVNTIDFVPSLPGWKTASIQRLGFGVLNKVIMEFPFVFWDENIDFFGATAERTEFRGRCFMFWNLKRTVGAPILSALVVGKAAIEEEKKESAESVEHALGVLRSIFGEASVPQPTAFVVTKWGSDPFSRGAYSYVAVGASGEDYDIIGRSVENCVFFAGEATCKEHPDTVGGAVMTGLREAVRIVDVLYNRVDSVAEAEAMAAAQRQSDTERNEVRDMTKRLTAAELSIAIRKDGGKLDEEEEPFNKAMLLQDMFGSAKTTSGRLLLAKEMLQLPASSLQAFAATREGLTVLNGWIQDSMGKDATQLLRHCVRLLLVVGKDLASVRHSGIGRTVKEKVVVHTSRDIRAVASQLVTLWVETFRKEKAARGIAKPLWQSPCRSKRNIMVSKVKAKDKVSRADISANVCRHQASEKESTSQGCSYMESIAAEVERKDSIAICSYTAHQEQVFNPISDSEAAALAAAEAAQAAANAAAKAYETAEAASTQVELPKIVSFHKFANKREHMIMPESTKRRSLEREVLVLHGKDQVMMGVDARNCKVRNWSIDFSDKCSYLGSPRVLAVQDSKTSSRDPDLSGLSSACIESVKEVRSVLTQPEERQFLGQEEAAPNLKEAANDPTVGLSMEGAQEIGLASSYMLPSKSVHSLTAGSCLDTSTKLSIDAKQFSREGLAAAKPASADARHPLRGSEHKRAVTDYVSNLLIPLYKTRKIDKDGFKSIVKKSAVKVIERQTEQEAAMEVSEFLDTKRKIKIRTLVDKFVERYLENVVK